MSWFFARGSASGACGQGAEQSAPRVACPVRRVAPPGRAGGGAAQFGVDPRVACPRPGARGRGFLHWGA